MEFEAIANSLKLSPNRDVLVLLARGDVQGAIARANALSTTEKSVACKVLRAFLQGQSKLSAANSKFEIPSVANHERSTLVLELIRLVLALHVGKVLPDLCGEIAILTHDWVTQLAVSIEKKAGDYPATAINTLVWMDGSALRARAAELARYFQGVGRSKQEGQMRFIRAKLTNSVMSHYRHLVGEAMVDVGKYFERQGDPKNACKYYDPFILDAECLLDEYRGTSDLPTREDAFALAMLREACSGFLRCGALGRAVDVESKLAQAEQLLRRPKQ